MTDHIKICEGISDISDSYNGFLIDQWGTLHNGKEPLPGVVDTLQNLKSRGKQIILISNSGKRATHDHNRLNDIGIDDILFDHIVTSAEVMWHHLNDSELNNYGQSCFLLNRLGDIGAVEGLETITVIDDIEAADFILLTGSDAPNKTLDNYYNDILKKASRRHLKMLCANPEKTITIGKENFMGSGEIAKQYESYGGVVHYIGKPHPSIFQYALGLFEDIYPSQICVIGDSLATDMRGARNLDLDCALIAEGVHKGSFSKVQSRADIHKMLTTLSKNYGVEPTYFIPRFHWGKALPDRKNKRKGS